MKVVVTGGLGFIGSNLVEALVAQGDDVTVIDDQSRGNLKNLSIGADFIPLDLTDLQGTIKAIKGADTVFHLAARIGNIEYLHNNESSELQTLQSNVLIDTNVFLACRQCNVKNLIYASSVAVYPLSKKPLSEDNLNRNFEGNMNPDGGYGWSKLMGEVQLGWLSPIKIGVVRIFNVYGKNSDLTKCPHVVSSFILRAIKGRKIVVWRGDQTRDFIYVSDCVGAILKLSEKLPILPEPITTINVGSGSAVSIETIALKVQQISTKTVKLAYNLKKLIGPDSQIADISLAWEILNWTPLVSLDEGLEKTYNWIKGKAK